MTGSNPATIEAARTTLGDDVTVIRADAGDVASQRSIASAVREAFGGLDVLFVNAGLGDFRPLEQWDEAGFDRSLAVNLKGPFFLIQALLPVFANPASIVLNTSINTRLGMPASSVYAASKAGLASLVRTLSGELIGRGIRVNAISPGPTATPSMTSWGWARPRSLRWWRRFRPAGAATQARSPRRPCSWHPTRRRSPSAANS